MRLSVIGCGYLGAVHAAAMASLGHEVVGVDTDERRVQQLAAGHAPFYEPGLAKLLGEALGSRRLRFSSDMAAASDAEVHFVCVGTPASEATGAADLGYLWSALDALLPLLRPGRLVAGKSTVPVGTAARVQQRIAATGAHLAWNPEFLREGHAIADTLDPDRIVAGVASGEAGARAAETLREVYGTAVAAGVPFVVTDLATAELAKGAANAFLAAKVSFINVMADVADAANADVTALTEILGHDPRIGHHYLGAGIGYGGGCLPKDLRAFIARAEELGAAGRVGLLREVHEVNAARRTGVVDRAIELAGGAKGRRIAVLGAAFKPGSDDMRDSPALDIAERLAARGAEVAVTDPAALAGARNRAPHLGYADDWRDALRGAHLVLLGTEWRQYRDIDPVEAASLVAERTVFDGRNCLDAAAWAAAGWRYVGVGRREQR